MSIEINPLENPLDHHNTTNWALAFVSGASFVASAQYFMLANRETGRAHELLFIGSGFTFGKNMPSLGWNLPNNLSYKSFQTRRPVQFSDFNKRGARITEIKTPIFDHTYLIAYDEGGGFFLKKLATISMGGFSLPSFTLTGQAFVNGVMSMNFGDGKLHGKIQHVWREKEEPKPPRAPRSWHYKNKAFEEPRIVLPGDVLFDFDSHRLKPAATPVLEEIMALIEVRDPRMVRIEGHTDSKGKPEHNNPLSEKRAVAVKQWLVLHKCEGATGFIAKGLGESSPVASNTKPDGSDDEAGRAKNRRVEIHFRLSARNAP